jgi:uncharacterized protein YbaR (Trm112 family)
MTLDPRLLAILADPDDHGPLFDLGPDGLYNDRARRRFRVVDGIPVMLLDEADTIDESEHARLMARVAAEGIRPTFDRPDRTA